MMKKLCILFAGCLAVFASAFSQDLKKDLELVYQTLDAAEYFHAKVETKVYYEGELGSVRQMEISKSGMNFSCKVEDQMSMINERVSLVVDEDQKVIVVTQSDFQGIKPKLSEQGIDLDSLVDAAGTYNYVGLEDGQRHYRILSPGNAIKQTDIFISPGYHCLTKLIYHYDEDTFGENSWAEVRYYDVNDKPAFEKGYFSEKRFYEKQGKAYVGVGNYKDYTINAYF